MGDIGKEKRETIEILPAEDPWPEHVTEPDPATPVAPPLPERKKDPVPA